MAEEHRLHFFEKYLTLWVALCIIIGLALGEIFPGLRGFFNDMTYYQVSLPIAILLFFMIYPIMVQIDFRKVIKAGKSPKPVGLTLAVNWGVKPFTMAFFAWIFMKHIFAPYLASDLAMEYQAGMILLGIAPCTAMVLVWSYLSDGNMGHTLVMVAINSLTMLFLFGPLAGILLGVSSIPVPWETIAFSVAIYVGLPLAAGFVSRKKLLQKKGEVWFEEKFAKDLHYVSIIALLTTLVVLFNFQGEVILREPLVIGMIAVPLLIQIFVIFGLTYVIAHRIGLDYEDAAPSAQIGASNHFEVAIAVATMLFGLDSGAALATVVGVLIEVPIMLTLVKICLKTRGWFE
ncbi:MAG: ACR3 family arsenite efflux transporter [Thermoplasmatota archaeon]